MCRWDVVSLWTTTTPTDEGADRWDVEAQGTLRWTRWLRAGNVPGSTAILLKLPSDDCAPSRHRHVPVVLMVRCVAASAVAGSVPVTVG
jgi:hypothetical protein